jgi:hypothetical protein
MIGLLFLFSGCSQKIDFNTYKPYEFTTSKFIVDKEKPRLNLSQLSGSVLSSLPYSKSDFNKNISFNQKLFYMFNTSSDDVKLDKEVKVELFLNQLNVDYVYIEPEAYKYKGETLYTKPYYKVYLDSNIATKITSKNNKISVFNTSKSLVLNLPSSFFYDYDLTIRSKDMFSELIQSNLDSVFVDIRNRLINPFEVIKVLKANELKEKDQPLYTFQINGGFCDGINSRMNASIYRNGEFVGDSESSGTISCNKSFFLPKNKDFKPKVFDKVFVKY